MEESPYNSLEPIETDAKLYFRFRRYAPKELPGCAQQKLGSGEDSEIYNDHKLRPCYWQKVL